VTDPFLTAVQRRVVASGLDAEGQLLAGCASYLRLLATWNERINLTSLPLASPIPDASIDRLVVEALRAVRWLDPDAVWVDLGSGGGSPAIPLKLARPSSRVTLVEARERKCAFLREVIRALGIPGARVLQTRFETLPLPTGEADVVTVRAVRIDEAFLDLVHRLLRPGGRLLLFGSPTVQDARFHRADPAVGDRDRTLQVLTKV
jgi:16S rRNA (guanine527-N7)-methyltransferase